MTEISNIKFGSTSVASYFTKTFVGLEYLSKNESLIASRFSGKRLSHFCTGRDAAKNVLRKFTTDEYEILAGSDGEPLWPHGYKGSISHSDELVGAIVTEDPEIVSVGLDIEKIGGIKPEMWELCFTNSEKLFLTSVKSADLDFYSTLLFSLKESFYKMQYPVTKKKIWFTDVEIDFSAHSNTFSISRSMLKEIVNTQVKLDFKVEGKYIISSSLLLKL